MKYKHLSKLLNCCHKNAIEKLRKILKVFSDLLYEYIYYEFINNY